MLKVRLLDYSSSIGSSNAGKYLLRLDGDTYFGATVSDVGENVQSPRKTSGGATMADVEIAMQISKLLKLLPKSGTLLIYLKDGSKIEVDLSKLGDIFVEH